VGKLERNHPAAEFGGWHELKDSVNNFASKLVVMPPHLVVEQVVGRPTVPGRICTAGPSPKR
jgi:hypothetical protein